jgi:MFS family permease
MGHATTFNQLLLSRTLMGISEAFYMPAALALITDYHKGPTQSLATGYGILNMLSTIIGGLGVYMASAMRDAQIGLSLVYQASAIALIVCSGILLLVLKTVKRES